MLSRSCQWSPRLSSCSIALRHSSAARAVRRSARLGRRPESLGVRTCYIWLEEVWTDRLGAMRGPEDDPHRRHPADRGGGMTEKSPEHELHRQRTEEPTL
jgi:hypothetical protein